MRATAQLPADGHDSVSASQPARAGGLAVSDRALSHFPLDSLRTNATLPPLAVAAVPMATQLPGEGQEMALMAAEPPVFSAATPGACLAACHVPWTSADTHAWVTLCVLA